MAFRLPAWTSSTATFPPDDAVTKDFMYTDLSEASPVETFDLKTCRSKLAEHYKRTAKVPTTAWSSICQLELDQIYTRLSGVKEEQTPAGSLESELTHYTDVFTANKNGDVPNRILVQGPTGIGKSTFVRKLAMDWAELDDEKSEDKQGDARRRFEDDADMSEDNKVATPDDEDTASEDKDTSSDEYEELFPEEEEALTEGLLSYIIGQEDEIHLERNLLEDHNEVDIHQIYTRLSWVTPAGSSQSELTHYTDVFTANKNGDVPNRILVQGRTGIGKSTFARKVVMDWAELNDEKSEDKQGDTRRRFEDDADMSEDNEVAIPDDEDTASEVEIKPFA
ncbi:hypothetical protein OS493_037768, partial [Desmophyllum pertusum]